MRVIGFVEGARSDAGGVGLVGVPLIHQALATRGHSDLLVVAGDMIPTGRAFQVKEPGEAFWPERRDRAGTYAVPGCSRWSFAPRIFGVSPLVQAAEFVTLHSLYSFPVLAGYLMAQRFRKPYGLWPHGVLATVQRRISRRRKSVYDAVVGRRILDGAAILFFSARGERDEARGLGLKAPSVIVPHGIDLKAYSALPPRGRFRRERLGGHEGPLVLYLGRLNEKKGLDLLIESAEAVVAAVPDTIVAIVGGAHPPAFGKKVADWIDRSAVGRHIVLTGVTDEQEKMEALADADVFVLPSQAENFGFAMFEAMASRVPVIVSDTLDYAAEVRAGGAGLTPRRSARAFSDAIVTTLLDRPGREAMGRNGAALAARYSWERCGQLVEATVSSVIRKQPLPAELEPEYPA